MKPNKIVELPEFTVTGLRYQGDISAGQIGEFWEENRGKLTELAVTEPAVSYGVTIGFTQDMQIDYLICLAAPAHVGFESVTIPAQNYAVFDFELAQIQQQIYQVHATWLPDSGFQRGYGPEFERYDAEFMKPEQPLTYWIPILT